MIQEIGYNDQMNYVKIDPTDMTGKWDDVIESEETASSPCIDNSLRVVKYEGSDPAWVASLGLTVYTSAAALWASVDIADWDPDA